MTVDFSRRDVLKTGLMAGAGSYAEQSLLADDAVPVRDRVFSEAERVFKNTRHTKYQHKQFIDEETGTYDVDCSDYVSYVLSRVAKRHLDQIPKEDWWPVPRAYKYYEFFAALPNESSRDWRRVERLEDVRRGDIIAWQLSGEIRKDHDTGHVWFVAGPPSSLEDQVIAVRSYDSAAMPHFDDTRVRTGSTFHDGVGEGTFHLRIDEAGKPVEFQFGPDTSFHKHPIAIGRLLPL